MMIERIYILKQNVNALSERDCLKKCYYVIMNIVDD